MEGERPVKWRRGKGIHTSIEQRKRFIKIEDLGHYTQLKSFPAQNAAPDELTQRHRDKYQEKIGKPVFKLFPLRVRHSLALKKKRTNLIITHDTRDNRGTQTGSYTDTESTYQAANENIPNHILVSVSWRQSVSAVKIKRGRVKINLGPK